MRKALFIVNPNAGKMVMKENLVDILSQFNAAGYINTVYITQKAQDATAYITHHGLGYDLIVSCGGDGTLNEILHGIAASDETFAPIACIPAGTVNDFAHSLGIPSDIQEAAKTILESVPQDYDFGTFNGEIFSYVAAAGAFTEVSYATPQYLKNMLGKYAYFLEASKKLTDLSDAISLKIEIDDELVIEGNFIMVAVSNSKSIGGFLQFKDTEKSMLTDGRFELTLIKSPTTPFDLQKLIHSINIREYDNDCIRSVKGKRFKITATKPLAWTLDGEYAGEYEEVDISLNKKRIQLVFPEE
ncbi:MAG: YegS/Rv2252/BmrU family lipid kinase [Peptococcaceae bacterium]|nr:YegS/Rv2252/BmrU family lipid kinase [Peptococcaceae bacterium]